LSESKSVQRKADDNSNDDFDDSECRRHLESTQFSSSLELYRPIDPLIHRLNNSDDVVDNTQLASWQGMGATAPIAKFYPVEKFAASRKLFVQKYKSWD